MEEYITEIKNLSIKNLLVKISEVSYIRSELNKQDFIIETKRDEITIHSLKDFNFKIIIKNKKNIEMFNLNNIILKDLKEKIENIIIQIRKDIELL